MKKSLNMLLQLGKTEAPLRRGLGLLALVVLVLSAMPAIAEEAACGSMTGAGQVAACGDISLSGSQTGGTSLYLPEPASIDLTPIGLIAKPRGIDVSVGSLFGGFLLIQDTPDRKGIGLLGGRYEDGSLAAENFPYTANVLGPASEVDNRLHLPAGPYLLYLISDGAPVTVSIRLDGLQGQQELTLSEPTTSQVRRLPAQLPGADTNANLYSAGYQTATAGPAFLMLVTSLGHIAHAGAADGNCGYSGPVNETVGFLPGCPGRATTDCVCFTGFNQTVQTPLWMRTEFYSVQSAPGTYGLGYWRATAGITPRAEALAVWLEL